MSATIKLFLPHGDPKRLRTAEISNWSGKAIAAPRTELEALLTRDEMSQSGIYILTGTDADSGKPMAYIGEAEILRDRLKSQRTREFWVTAVAFMSKDDNLTKAHIRFLEGRLIEDAKLAGRFVLDNVNPSGSKLPESDRHDMEVFLQKIHQLLPVLGVELLTPLVPLQQSSSAPVLTTTIKGLKATGQRTATGFVVLAGSEGVKALRAVHPDSLPAHRKELIQNGDIKDAKDRIVFVNSVEFPSPSAAAIMIHGGNVSGPALWKDSNGRSLRDLEEAAG